MAEHVASTIKMSWAERLQNILFGLNFIAWALLPFFREGAAAITPATFATGAINFIVGVLFFLRRPEIEGSSIRSLLFCVPSIITYAIAFRHASPTNDWPILANILVSIGGIWTVISFAFLGRCFAIFPSFRSVANGGPYQLIRHPAYLGELVLLLACLAAKPSLIMLGLATLTVFFLVVRIYDEEQLLLKQQSYADYASRVMWRLLPFIW